jgi:hypothetical protein
MCTVLDVAILPFVTRTTSIISTTVICNMLTTGAPKNTWLKLARQIPIGAIQSIELLDIRPSIGMARAAAMSPFPTGIILIIWSMDACTIRTAIIATTTVRWRWSRTEWAHASRLCDRWAILRCFGCLRRYRALRFLCREAHGGAGQTAGRYDC